MSANVGVSSQSGQAAYGPFAASDRTRSAARQTRSGNTAFLAIVAQHRLDATFQRYLHLTGKTRFEPAPGKERDFRTSSTVLCGRWFPARLRTPPLREPLEGPPRGTKRIHSMYVPPVVPSRSPRWVALTSSRCLMAPPSPRGGPAHPSGPAIQTGMTAPSVMRRRHQGPATMSSATTARRVEKSRGGS